MRMNFRPTMYQNPCRWSLELYKGFKIPLLFDVGLQQYPSRSMLAGVVGVLKIGGKDRVDYKRRGSGPGTVLSGGSGGSARPLMPHSWLLSRPVHSLLNSPLLL